MTDHSMLFSAPMVRAELEDRKTHTRRLPAPYNTLFDGRRWTKAVKAQEWDWDNAWADEGPSPAGNPGPYLHLPWLSGKDESFKGTIHRVYPTIQPGDRIWARETWAPLDRLTHSDPGTQALIDKGFYRADRGTVEGEISKWTPAIHMPRWASRLTLLVTGVKVERLQDISEEDAIAEGIERSANFPDRFLTPAGDYAVPIVAYQRLWESINGPNSWNANPWVFAYIFTVVKQNIDRIAP